MLFSRSAADKINPKLQATFKSVGVSNYAWNRDYIPNDNTEVYDISIY